MMHILEMLVYMIAAHFLLDYALQGDWMSKAKNATLDLVPGEKIWPLALFGHALLHATAVQIITSNWWLFTVELVLHFLIDHRKCRGDFGYNYDQMLHLSCKVLYAAALAAFALSRFA